MTKIKMDAITLKVLDFIGNTVPSMEVEISTPSGIACKQAAGMYWEEVNRWKNIEVIDFAISPQKVTLYCIL